MVETAPTSGDTLKRRTLSALVLIPLVIAALYYGDNFFVLLMLIATVAMFIEWLGLTRSGKPRVAWVIGGIAYVFIPCILLTKLRFESHGFMLVMAVFLVIWATDIGGYIAGKKLKGPKLAPRISPGKTWSGLIGAMLCAGITGLLLAWNTWSIWSPSAILLGALCAVVAQAGDLGESYIKRRFGVKDSGHIIPGHGGLLDRLDGLIALTPFIWLVHTYLLDEVITWLTA